ncbi:MAG: monovalent cation/H(+) antiporter subunit G [Dongiaceae bacterium]
MAAIADLLSWSLILSGSLFAITGGVGVLRLPDFYTRLHGASITDTAGAGLIMLGLMLQAGLTLVTVKLVLILAFLFLTGPTATHALARAALISGVKPWQRRLEETESSKA